MELLVSWVMSARPSTEWMVKAGHEAGRDILGLLFGPVFSDFSFLHLGYFRVYLPRLA